MIIEGDQDNDEDDQAETLDMRSAKVVVLMPLEESSQSSPQRIRLQQASPGDGIIKELLNLGEDLSRGHWGGRRRGSESSPLLSTPFFARAEHIAIQTVVCARTVNFFAIVYQPLGIVGQRDVAMFQIPILTNFGRQMRRFTQFPIFRRFRAVSLSCGHKADLSVTGALGSDYMWVTLLYGHEEVE